ncbi:MAG: MarR family transcriptional regulator [Methylophilaceae bacterium]|nr:MarR family transcriptional regulator [Methylophilaceae bacterium]
MLQLRDLPTIETLQKFANRYPEADVSAVSTFLSLLRAAADLSAALDACLSRHDLLQGRWWVLILLMREDSKTSTPSILAEKSGVSRATMTGLLDGLEQSNLVARMFTKQDRRTIFIKLTEAGQAKLDMVMPDYYSRLSECMKALNEQDREKLQQILTVVNAGAEALLNE